MLENKAFFIGNLAKDAEIKQTREGKTYLSFSIAVNSHYKNNVTTQYVECTRWGEVANIAPYLMKGTLVAVEGRISSHAYLKDNRPMSSLALNVFELQLLGGMRK